MILPVFLLSILLFTFKKGSGDQRWNRWERGQEGEKPLFTFLLLKAFFSPPGAQDKG